MADKVTFRGATVRYYDGRRSEGGSFVRIHFTTEYTAPVAEAMGWEDPGESVESANLKGELVGTHLVMTPNEKKLKEYGITLDINFVGDFKLVRITENESTRRELRFIVRSPAIDCAALIDQYVRRVADQEAALTISYTVQAEMDLAESKPATA